MALISVGAVSCSHSISDRLVEISAQPGGANSPASDSSDLSPNCTPDNLVVRPGERIRFRMTNFTDKQIEFIVVTEEKRDLRRNINTISETIRSGLRQISILQIHDGHEGEEGPDKTEDYLYRMIIQAAIVGFPGKRTMVVTFPEAGEAVEFQYFLCSYLDAPELDEGVFTRR